MQNKMVSTVFAVLVLGLSASGGDSVGAAEFRLRAQCQCEGSLATLGDVAEIIANDPKQAETLAAIELFPAPAASRQRHVQMREIHDLLLLRGLNLADHWFSGASRVTILGGSAAVVAAPQRRLTASITRRATRQLSEAIVQYLNQYVADELRIVDVQLDEDQTRLLISAGREISIAGGAAPWTGLQRFEVTVDTPDEPVRFALDAEVSVPAAVVVSTRSLLRGTIIHDADVQLQRVTPEDARAGGFHSIDQVVGKETTRAIAKGKILQGQSVRPPLLVRRGKVVTLYARSSGIRVSTDVRAREDGSLGDLILVESLLDRTPFLARVSNVREVEVLARSVKTAGANAVRQAEAGTGRLDSASATRRRNNF